MSIHPGIARLMAGTSDQNVKNAADMFDHVTGTLNACGFHLEHTDDPIFCSFAVLRKINKQFTKQLTISVSFHLADEKTQAPVHISIAFDEQHRWRVSLRFFPERGQEVAWTLAESLFIAPDLTDAEKNLKKAVERKLANPNRETAITDDRATKTVQRLIEYCRIFQSP